MPVGNSAATKTKHDSKQNFPYQVTSLHSLFFGGPHDQVAHLLLSAIKALNSLPLSFRLIGVFPTFSPHPCSGPEGKNF